MSEYLLAQMPEDYRSVAKQPSTALLEGASAFKHKGVKLPQASTSEFSSIFNLDSDEELLPFSPSSDSHI